MSKRSREPEHGERPPKRAKDDSYEKIAPEEIHFARQLQDLLRFRQDGLHQLTTGISSFKAFLESILYHRDEDLRPRQLSILREYLESQKPADENDPEKPFLGHLWQAWSFASQNNNDRLTSQVSSILSQLLRTLSGLLDFRDFGILLCRSILLHQNLRLVKRSLDAPKHKDFVISPCLRLLSEVTSFDGGVLAREVYKRREQTFDAASLRRNLGLVKLDISEEDVRRRPSIRILTVRYILAHLKYQQEGAKIDILKNRPLCISLYHFLQDDPAELVNEILSVSEQYVLKDALLPRSAKAALLTQHNLERVTEIATRSGEEHPAAQRAFEWLQAACTKPEYGILRTSAWYPPGLATVEVPDQTSDVIDLGLDSLGFYDSTDRPDVRNTTLLGYIQTLRPHADARERELVIACFQSTPELVAAYFAEKNMQLEPKLSNTWVGHASFLFEVLRLPVPQYLGNVDAEAFAELPPPTNIVLESLLPKPLTQKMLTRYLNQSSELITFFALRLLVLALQKLQHVQKEFEQAAAASIKRASLWREASGRLLSRFMERAPIIKDVISVFRKMRDDDEHVLQREASLRLLRLYYEVAPIQALEEQLDVSSALAAALMREGDVVAKTEISALRTFELEHLLDIARQSPGMRWFNKQGALAFSPCVSLLKLHLRDVHHRPTRELVVHVLSEPGIVRNDREVEALVASLSGEPGLSDHIWTFLDDCLGRVSRQPVKYVDYLTTVLTSEMAQTGDEEADIDFLGLIAAAISEQAPHVMEKADVTSWVNSLLLLLAIVHDSTIVQALRKKIGTTSEQRHAPDITEAKALLRSVMIQEPDVTTVEPEANKLTEALSLHFESPPLEQEDHPELVRWAQKNLDLAIQEGDVDALMLCLCSQHHDVRAQALAQLSHVRNKLQTATVDSKDQISILIGELRETYEQQCLPEDKPLPYIAGAFATSALQVLSDPTHPIYPKLNRYLMRSPEWRIAKLPSYWLSKTALSLPDEDDGYWKEVQWVLLWLVGGTRSLTDVDLLRRSGAYEKAMGLFCSPQASIRLVREKVLQLLFNATCAEGGSNVLITRCAVLAWLDMVKTNDGDLAALLRRRVLETCDRKRIEKWSGATIEDL